MHYARLHRRLTSSAVLTTENVIFLNDIRIQTYVRTFVCKTFIQGLCGLVKHVNYPWTGSQKCVRVYRLATV